MFSYYGSKSKLAKLYPAPRYDRIIEPFAGSARYSLLYADREVTLFDANPLIVDIWNYLIDASPADILALPDIESKRYLSDIKGLADVERALIGFHLCRGKAKPRNMGHGQNSWNRDKLRIAGEVGRIKHWKVGCYKWTELAFLDIEATWFIDPPYQKTQVSTNSDRYPFGDDIDYAQLAEFVKTRNGQTIVCEGDGADWLPFEFLKTTNANTNNRAVKKNGEYVFYS